MESESYNQGDHEIESSITHRVLSKTPSPLNEGNKSTSYNTQVVFQGTQNDYPTATPAQPPKSKAEQKTVPGFVSSQKKVVFTASRGLKTKSVVAKKKTAMRAYLGNPVYASQNEYSDCVKEADIEQFNDMRNIIDYEYRKMKQLEEEEL